MGFGDPSGSVFAPAQVRALTAAFNRSWRALSFAFPDDNSKKALDVREKLAGEILTLAREGEEDPTTLSNDALARLPPYPARQAQTQK
jgi:hypothetical protein